MFSKALFVFILLTLLFSSSFADKAKESIRYTYKKKKKQKRKSPFKEEMEEQLGNAISWMSTSTVQISTEITLEDMQESRHKKNRLEFIAFNYTQIQQDIAQGGGEYLDTLARLYEVKDIAHWEYILQQIYPRLYKERLSVETFDKKMIKLTQYLNEKW